MHPLTILAVLAHPDDEAFLGGGTLASFARRGARTALLTVTDGQAGRAGISGRAPLVARDELGAWRREELRRAARVLGVGELITPGWRDGRLAEVPREEGVRLAVEAVRRVRPGVVFTFGPEGGPSGHPDHKAVGEWATEAFERAGDPEYSAAGAPHEAGSLYWIAWPSEADRLRGVSGPPITTVIELDEDSLARKRRAFEEHASQQDFREIYDRLLAILDGREHFHRARALDGGARDLEPHGPP